MNITRTTIITIAAVTAFGINLAAADVISDRKAGFRGNVVALKAIRSAMAERDMSTITAQAEKMASWFAVMPDYFPASSSTGDTNARPEIWENWDKFTAISSTAEAASRDLAAAASSGDMAAVNAGFKAVAGTCKTCHQSFKN